MIGASCQVEGKWLGGWLGARSAGAACCILQVRSRQMGEQIAVVMDSPALCGNLYFDIQEIVLPYDASTCRCARRVSVAVVLRNRTLSD